jgi:hypothetical protein
MIEVGGGGVPVLLLLPETTELMVDAEADIAASRLAFRSLLLLKKYCIELKKAVESVTLLVVLLLLPLSTCTPLKLVAAFAEKFPSPTSEKLMLLPIEEFATSKEEAFRKVLERVSTITLDTLSSSEVPKEEDIVVVVVIVETLTNVALTADEGGDRLS